MTEIKNLIQNLQDIAGRYGLKMLYLDSTDNILISRIGFSLEIFIETYINLKKEKINMALVVAGERIYGVDNQGGFFHEHPFENPSLHVKTNQIEIEGFTVRSLEYLKKLNLLG